MQIGAEQEDVQHLIYGEILYFKWEMWCAGSEGIIYFLLAEVSELASRGCPDGVSRSGGEDIHSHLRQRGAIDFRELHFEQHLAIMRDRHEYRVHNVLGIHRRHLSQILNYMWFGSSSGQEQAPAIGLQLQVLIGVCFLDHI